MGLHTKPVFRVSFDISIESVYEQNIYGWKDTDVYFLGQKLEFNLEHYFGSYDFLSELCS